MFEAKIVLDSLNTTNKCRLTTFQLTYPRWIHGEVMTHRVFSRNAMSSRAVPVKKMIEQVRNNPATPICWGKNIPGMQSREELIGQELEDAKRKWFEFANNAADNAEKLAELGLHKQWCNRLVEPFQWMHTIVTATEFDNFWELRCHPDAQPEFYHLATMMKKSYNESTPNSVKFGYWHLPYVSFEDRCDFGIELCIKFSVARCARVSYLNHDGTNPLSSKDIDLHDKLVLQKPIHASPAEHQAVAVYSGAFEKNFKGWYQYRSLVEKGIQV